MTIPNANRGLVEALERIVEVGTRTETIRVGDAWSPGGWQDNEIVSEEAQIAAEALASISSPDEGAGQLDELLQEHVDQMAEHVIPAIDRDLEEQRVLANALRFPDAPATQAEPPDIEAIKKAAYKQGWNDREGDFLVGLNRISPARAQAEREALAVAVFKCAFHQEDVATPELLETRKRDFVPTWEHALECADAILSLLESRS